MSTAVPIRVRIAPSPTGPLHVGTARTALFNYLFARNHGGAFILRVEDTDMQRSTKAFEGDILRGLQWLGLTWDEGPDRGGEYGPYRQSERTSLYQAAFDRLLAQGSIYPCFCSTEELERERADQTKRGVAPIYSGRCRDLTPEERQQRETSGLKPIFRLRTDPEAILVDDQIRGTVRFLTEHIGDFSVAKSRTEPLYNFAVVVDDAAMKISHVIRGEDHLSNTPKQLLLFRALGMRPPLFAHVPLLLSPDRKKLSKRDAVTSLDEYRTAGILPETMVNFLALLGWNPKDEREVFSLDELTKAFRLDHVQKSGAIFDQRKLEHLNAVYLRALPPEELIRRAGETLTAARAALDDRLVDAVALVRDRCVRLTDLPSALLLFQESTLVDSALLIPKKGAAERTLEALETLESYCATLKESEFSSQRLHELLESFIKAKGFSRSEAFWPFRVALSGQKNSPGVFDIAAILGKKKTLARLRSARQLLGGVAEQP